MRARFPYRFALSLTAFTLVALGCGEKAAAPQAGVTKTTKCSSGGLKLSSSKTSNCNDDDDDDSTTTGKTTTGKTTSGGTTSGGTTSGGSGSDGLFDICAAAAGNADVSGSTLLNNICPDLASLAASQFTGGAPTVNPVSNIAGGLLTIDVKTSSLLPAAIADWWALMQMQLKDTTNFEAKFPNGYSKTTSLDNRQPTGDQVSYDYSSYRDATKNEDAKVEYCAITKFVTLSAGVAYAQVTTMDKSKAGCALSVTDMHGLVLVLKKDATHTLTYSSSRQVFQDSADHLSEIQQRATNNIKEEQGFTGVNAPNAHLANGG